MKFMSKHKKVIIRGLAFLLVITMIAPVILSAIM